MTDPSLPEEQRVDVSRSPRTLEMREWQILVNTFKKWPFRPTVRRRVWRFIHLAGARILTVPAGSYDGQLQCSFALIFSILYTV